MPIPTFTINGECPRILIKESELDGKRAEIVSGGLSQEYYNDLKEIVYGPKAWLMSVDPAIYMEKESFHEFLLALLTVWWMEPETSFGVQGKQHAEYLLNVASGVLDLDGSYTTSSGTGYDASGNTAAEKQSFAMACALGFDALYGEWSGVGGDGTSESKLADKIYANRNLLPLLSSELMHGDSAGNQVANFFGACALKGRSWTDGSDGLRADTLFEESLGFWFDQLNGTGRLGYNRYFMSNGGGGRGAYYEQQEMRHTALFLEAFSNALTSVSYDGGGYDILAGETWIKKIPEWFIRTSLRGDHDYSHLGDTDRRRGDTIDAFWSTMKIQGWRNAFSFLCAHGGEWRKNMRWLYDLKHNKEVHSGLYQYTNDPFRDSSSSTYLSQLLPRTVDWLLFDWDAEENQAQSPSNSETVPDQSRLFSPPGSYWYHNTWEVASSDGSAPGVNNCIINIHCPTFYYYGHIDLDVGSIRINVRDDQVVCKRGLYDPDFDTLKFGGSHHRRYKNQTISGSGMVLVDDGEVANTSLGRPHKTLDADGGSLVLDHAQGGQLFKESQSGALDPGNVSEMEMGGNGNTWRRANRFDEPEVHPDGIRLIESTVDYDYLTADLRRAYLKKEEDAGSSTPGVDERVLLYKAQWMVIKRDFDLPVIFMHHRVQSKTADMTRRQIWNFWGEPSSEPEADDVPLAKFYQHLNASLFRAKGFSQDYGSPEDIANRGGNCTVAYYSTGRDPTANTGIEFIKSGFDWTSGAQGQADGWSGAFNYKVGDVNKSYPPGGTDNEDGVDPNLRELKDLGKFRMEVQVNQNPASDTTSFVCLVIPSIPNQNNPDGYDHYEAYPTTTNQTFRFSESDGFYVLEIDGNFGNRVYRLGATSSAFKNPTESIDSTAPTAPNGVTANPGPGTGQITLNWNNNDETQGVENYNLYRRVKVT